MVARLRHQPPPVLRGHKEDTVARHPGAAAGFAFAGLLRVSLSLFAQILPHVGVVRLTIITLVVPVLRVDRLTILPPIICGLLQVIHFDALLRAADLAVVGGLKGRPTLNTCHCTHRNIITASRRWVAFFPRVTDLEGRRSGFSTGVDNSEIPPPGGSRGKVVRELL